jgi:hypothetical protein
MSRIHAPHVEGRFGADASDTLLCAAVYLSLFENRQMNASKLADYVGVPRSTMDLEELERVDRRGTTGAKVNNKINDLCTLTGYSDALIANGNFRRRPPHPRVKLGCQLLRKLPRLRSR